MLLLQDCKIWKIYIHVSTKKKEESNQNIGIDQLSELKGNQYVACGAVCKISL